VDPSQVIITTGSQQALDIVVRALATRRVAVEDPVYSHARFLFENLGATLSPLRLDPFEGIDLDGWRAVIERDAPSLLYSITRFQNPTGYSYQPHELDALLALSERTAMGLLEDDWGSDMLSDGEYRPTLRALGGDNVLYANSFTKKLLPSLRVGYLVAPRALVPTLVAMKRLSTLGNPWLTEAVLSEFLDRGYYDTHLRAVQAALDARYARCLEALSARMPEGCRWTLPGGGPTLWLEVPRSVDVQRLSAQMAARGVNIESAAAHFAGARHLNGFRVSYAFVGEADLDRALTILGDELREAMR
jgi:DNA-binding transcriptional MocR family regulator